MQDIWIRLFKVFKVGYLQIQIDNLIDLLNKLKHFINKIVSHLFNLTLICLDNNKKDAIFIVNLHIRLISVAVTFEGSYYQKGIFWHVLFVIFFQNCQKNLSKLHASQNFAGMSRKTFLRYSFVYL